MEPDTVQDTANAIATNESFTYGSDFSMAGLFMQADIVVKMVILLLVAASLWSWVIIFSRLALLRRLNRQADNMEESFWDAGDLWNYYERVRRNTTPDPLTMIFIIAMYEWERTLKKSPDSNKPHVTRNISDRLLERLERIMHITLNVEINQIERGVSFLATTGATAPFIGLFGTVWGIMNSFQSIALSHSTSLAVVAPGIAEALFATALGLLVAIPSVIAYNKISRDIEYYGERLHNFVEEFSTLLSRETAHH